MKRVILSLAAIFVATSAIAATGSPARQFAQNPFDRTVLRGDLSVSARWFGASGNNRDDNTTAFQNAYTAAVIRGASTIFIPAGTYRVTTMPAVTTVGITFRGEGPGATIIKTTSTTGNVFSFGNAAAPFSPCGGVTDLTVSSSVTRVSGYAIKVDGCEYGVLDRLKLQTTGGNGIEFSTTVLATIWFVSRVDIEISGAFTGIHENGTNEIHVKDTWIRGNLTAGSRGVVINNAGGSFYTDVDIVTCEIGVELDSVSSITWLHFMNVMADSNTLYGWYFHGAGTLSGIDCSSCWASTNGTGSSSSRGFLFSKGNGILLHSPRVFANGGHGIEMEAGVKNVEIAGGIITGNSQASAGTSHGVVMTGTDSVRIHDARVGATGIIAGSSQGYGIFINSTANTNYVISGNDLSTNITGGILSGDTPVTSSTRRIYGNIVPTVIQEGLGATRTFAAGDYTSDVGTWTATSGNTSFRYLVEGRKMTVWFDVATTTTTGTPLLLKIAIPGGYTAFRAASFVYSRFNGAAWTTAVASVALSGTTIDLYVDSTFGGAAWPNSAAITVRGQITIEV